MNKKALVIATMMAIGSMVMPVSAAETDGIEVIVDNKVIEFDVQPTIVNDRTMVPLRGIFEALNITPQWDGKTRTVTVKGDNVSMELQVDSNTAIIGNKEVTLDSPATIVNGRTLVPARFIAESTGAQINWDQDSKTVLIKSNIPGKEGLGGSEGSGEGSEAGEGNEGREGSENGSESGEGGEDAGEEAGAKLTLNDTYDYVRKGARLVMKYDRSSNSFRGIVSNTTNKTLQNVRIEIHLSNGIELGPTTPIDLAPNAAAQVEMKATQMAFSGWTPHAEVGLNEHGGSSYEGSEGSEGNESNEGNEGREGSEGKGESSEGSSEGTNEGREGSSEKSESGSEGRLEGRSERSEGGNEGSEGHGSEGGGND